MHIDSSTGFLYLYRTPATRSKCTSPQLYSSFAVMTKKGFMLAGYYFTRWRMWQVVQNYVGENNKIPERDFKTRTWFNLSLPIQNWNNSFEWVEPLLQKKPVTSTNSLLPLLQCHNTESCLFLHGKTRIFIDLDRDTISISVSALMLSFAFQCKFKIFKECHSHLWISRHVPNEHAQNLESNNPFNV